MSDGEKCWDCNCDGPEECLSAARIAGLEDAARKAAATSLTVEGQLQDRIAELEYRHDQIHRQATYIAELEALLRRWLDWDNGVPDTVAPHTATRYAINYWPRTPKP